MSKLGEVIRFDPQRGFILPVEEDGKVRAAYAGESVMSEVDSLLADLAKGGPSGDARQDHVLLAQAVVPPIAQAIPYTRWTEMFFEPVNYGDTEDNRLPVEDITTLAWQTTGESQVMFTAPGYLWTRPTFIEFDSGIEMYWRRMERAGWNVLQRAMERVRSDIARQIDSNAQTALDTAIAAVSQNSTVSGGKLTKASVDAVIKAAQQIGFPMTMAMINPGTLTDMTSWSGGVFTSGLAEEDRREMITSLYVGRYGGIQWYTNPNCPTAYAYLSGPAGMGGYEQRRKGMRTYSDVDIVRKKDLHTFLSGEYAWYVGNGYNYRSIQITA